MKFTFDEIIKAADAQVLYKTNTSGVFSISTDSRNISSNDIYLPLKGEKFDGHNFINDALKKGARGYFTSDNRHRFFGNPGICRYRLFLAYQQRIFLLCRQP